MLHIEAWVSSVKKNLLNAYSLPSFHWKQKTVRKEDWYHRSLSYKIATNS